MVWPLFERGVNFWEPWRDARQLKDEMDRLLRRYVPERSGMPSEYPAVNIWSDDEQALVTAELPGVDINKLDITVQDDQMTLRGDRGTHDCAEGEVYHRRERGCGEFIRTIGLPFGVDNDKVDAVYKNGVLKVTLPRVENEKPKKISVKSA